MCSLCIYHLLVCPYFNTQRNKFPDETYRKKPNTYKMEKLFNCTNKGILVNLAFFIKKICDAYVMDMKNYLCKKQLRPLCNGGKVFMLFFEMAKHNIFWNEFVYYDMISMILVMCMFLYDFKIILWMFLSNFSIVVSN